MLKIKLCKMFFFFFRYLSCYIFSFYNIYRNIKLVRFLEQYLVNFMYDITVLSINDWLNVFTYFFFFSYFLI